MSARFDQLPVTSVSDDWLVGMVRSTVVTGVAFTLTAFALFVLAPISGTIYGVALIPGSIPLQTADARIPVALASVGIGTAYLYATPLSAGFFLPGILVGAVLDHGVTPVAIVLGVAAAAVLTVVTGCHCGAGSAVPLVLKVL